MKKTLKWLGIGCLVLFGLVVLGTIITPKKKLQESYQKGTEAGQAQKIHTSIQNKQAEYLDTLQKANPSPTTQQLDELDKRVLKEVAEENNLPESEVLKIFNDFENQRAK